MIKIINIISSVITPIQTKVFTIGNKKYHRGFEIRHTNHEVIHSIYSKKEIEFYDIREYLTARRYADLAFLMMAKGSMLQARANLISSFWAYWSFKVLWGINYKRDMLIKTYTKHINHHQQTVSGMKSGEQD